MEGVIEMIQVLSCFLYTTVCLPLQFIICAAITIQLSHTANNSHPSTLRVRTKKKKKAQPRALLPLVGEVRGLRNPIRDLLP